MHVKELFSGLRMAANTSLTFQDIRSIGGFLASATGTIAVTEDGVTIVAATPVTEGVYTPIPLSISGTAVVTLAGGAAGTLFL